MDRFRLAATAAFSLSLLAGAATAQTTPPAEAPAPPPAPDAAQPPAPAAEAPPAPPAPTHALPTAGIAAYVVAGLDKACAPMVRGAAVKATASANGMRVNGDGDLVEGLDNGRRITIQAPTTANPNNCTLTVRYVAGEDGAILEGLQAWAERRDPPLAPDKTAAQSPEDGGVSVTSTWLGYANGKAEGVVFILHNKTDGTPQGGRIGEAQVLYSYRSY